MTPQEIKAFAARTGYDDMFTPEGSRRVVIRAPKEKGGVYMTLTGFNGATKNEAFVYDYVADCVARQVEVAHSMGMFIEVEAA